MRGESGGLLASPREDVVPFVLCPVRSGERSGRWLAPRACLLPPGHGGRKIFLGALTGRPGIGWTLDGLPPGNRPSSGVGSPPLPGVQSTRGHRQWL